MTRGRLESEPFSYRAGKDGAVFLEYEGRVVKTLRNPEAGRFLARIAGLEVAEGQLLLARLTGNFKRGNEH